MSLTPGPILSSSMYANNSIITQSLIIGAKNVITRKHLEKVKKNCIICNMGHSNQEIDLESLKDLKREKIRKNVTHITMHNGKTVVMLAEVHCMCIDSKQCVS